MRKTTNYSNSACNNVSAASADAAGVPGAKGEISLGEIALISLVSGAVAATLGLGADLLKDWLTKPSEKKEEPAKKEEKKA